MDWDSDDASQDQTEPSTKKAKRNRWNEEDNIQILIIWEEFETELRENKRNSHVYTKMAKKMGNKFTPREIHTKIRNLSARYRGEKKEWETAGIRPSWEHYEQVAKIVANRDPENTPIFESFTFEYPSNSSMSPTVPMPLVSPTLPSPTSSSSSKDPLPKLSRSSLPAASCSEEKNGNDSKILECIQKQTEYIKRQTEQGHMQLQLMQHLCKDFTKFLQKQEENDKVFIEIFQKLSDEK